jgi:hypothetical protein
MSTVIIRPVGWFDIIAGVLSESSWPGNDTPGPPRCTNRMGDLWRRDERGPENAFIRC